MEGTKARARSSSSRSSPSWSARAMVSMPRGVISAWSQNPSGGDFEKRPAGDRQAANDRIAVVLGEAGGRAAGGVIAALAFPLEDHDRGGSGEFIGGTRAGDAAADDEDVDLTGFQAQAGHHRQGPAAGSATTPTECKLVVATAGNPIPSAMSARQPVSRADVKARAMREPCPAKAPCLIYPNAG